MSNIEKSPFKFGCLPTCEASRHLRAAQTATAKSLDFLWENQSEMPAITWDSALVKWLDQKGDQADELRERGICCLPWVVLAALPKDRKTSDELYFTQGAVNDCAFHSDAFAYHATLLSALIAKGAPLTYRPINPIVGYYLSEPGNWGGRTIAQTTEQSNRYGRYPIDLVGANNQNVPKGYQDHEEDAKRFQLGFAYLPGQGDELVKNIVRCCRADMGISFGNMLEVVGCSKDKNGVKVPKFGGRWMHATSISNYRKVGSTEYVWWSNSHGGLYKGSTEGDPDDGCWMRVEDQLVRFAATMSTFDAPYLHFCEGTFASLWSFRPTLDLRFPDGFKR